MRYARWLVVLAVVVLTLIIVVQLLAMRHANRPANHAKAGLVPSLCLPGQASGLDRFARVRGCIVYTDGADLWAVDPNHPPNRTSLGRSNGMTPLAWSRYGDRLLLRRLTSSPSEWKSDLYVMNADGSQTTLTSDGLGFDGSFSRFDIGIYVVDVKGGTPRLIARSYLAWWLGSPAWSPDGSRIAYLVYLEGGPNGLTYEIWTVNPDGSDQRRLVDLGTCEGGGCILGLTWSPDGSRLAFQAESEKPGKPGTLCGASGRIGAAAHQ